MFGSSSPHRNRVAKGNRGNRLKLGGCVDPPGVVLVVGVGVLGSVHQSRERTKVRTKAKAKAGERRRALCRSSLQDERRERMPL